MKLLVFGGTKFLGRGTVEAALARGHEVTLFNRGTTNPGLFQEVEQIHGDLKGDLSALAGRAWDAAIDHDPTQLPRFTRARAEAVSGSVGHYVFVSTISVYADPSQPITEDSALLEEADADEFDLEKYGNFKAGSERVVREVFGERGAIARAGLIIGPHDPTDRFTYWPRRFADGGDVLAPGTPAQPLQFVDARDLGAFLVTLAENKTSGIFNATGPAQPLTLGETLERIKGDANLVWVDDQKLLDADVGPWMELPLWIPGETEILKADISRALAAGITFRPVEDTARDTLAWSREAGEQRPTLTREKEAEILASV